MKEYWNEIEDLYFNKGHTMTNLSILFAMPYRRVQKHLQRCPQYRKFKQDEWDNRKEHFVEPNKMIKSSPNVQNAIDELERVVRKQTEQIDKLDGCRSDTKIYNHIDKPRIVGVVGDLHAPFTHKGYLPFLIDTFKTWGVTDVVFAGDIVDLHAISRHQTEPSAKGAEREYQMAYDVLQEYVKAFPIAKVVLGNHDCIPSRQVATLGMPEVFLKSFHELWGLPEEWEIDNHFIIDNTLYHHGLGASGQNGAINKALNERMSVVQGHQHSSFQIEYRANQRDIIFGISCGCGVDNSAYSFNYGKYAIKKPILGTAIIKSSSEAYIVPMPEDYFRGV